MKLRFMHLIIPTISASTAMLGGTATDPKRSQPQPSYRYNFVTSKIPTPMFARPQASLCPTCSLPFGTLLSGCVACQNWATVRCDNGTCGFMPLNNVIDLATIPYTNIDAMRTLIVQRVQFFTRQAYNLFNNTAYEQSTHSYLSSNSPAAFIQQLYRACGLYIPYTPRDMHTQSSRVTPQNLKLGDLVIFFVENSKYEELERISVYIGNSEFISCSSTRVGFMVHKVPLALLFNGHSIDELSQNMKLSNSATGTPVIIRFCSFLTSTKDLKKMYETLCS